MKELKKIFVFGDWIRGKLFPKDVRALVKSSTDVNYEPRILNAVMEVNRIQRGHLFLK
jgi:UDPglucose 6-dehydrogenase